MQNLNQWYISVGKEAKLSSQTTLPSTQAFSISHGASVTVRLPSLNLATKKNCLYVCWNVVLRKTKAHNFEIYQSITTDRLKFSGEPAKECA